MNKLIPIAILLLTAGSIYLVSQHKNTDEDLLSSTDENGNSTTFMQWRTCIGTQPLRQCKDLDKKSEAQCNKASSDVAALTYPDVPNELASCKQFDSYQNGAQSDDRINSQGFYENCYLNRSVIQLAQQNNYYYYHIYYPRYIRCAGF